MTEKLYAFATTFQGNREAKQQLYYNEWTWSTTSMFTWIQAPSKQSCLLQKLTINRFTASLHFRNNVFRTAATTTTAKLHYDYYSSICLLTIMVKHQHSLAVIGYFDSSILIKRYIFISHTKGILSLFENTPQTTAIWIRSTFNADVALRLVSELQRQFDHILNVAHLDNIGQYLHHLLWPCSDLVHWTRLTTQ